MYTMYSNDGNIQDIQSISHDVKRQQAKQSTECIPSSTTISKDCGIKALDYTRNCRGYILVHVLNNYEQDHNMKM